MKLSFLVIYLVAFLGLASAIAAIDWQGEAIPSTPMAWQHSDIEADRELTEQTLRQTEAIIVEMHRLTTAVLLLVTAVQQQQPPPTVYPLDINTATPDQLARIPNQNFVAWITAGRPYASPDDISNKLGDDNAAMLLPYLDVK